jgi:hypothetical protein
MGFIEPSISNFSSTTSTYTLIKSKTSLNLKQILFLGFFFQNSYHFDTKWPTFKSLAMDLDMISLQNILDFLQ